MGSGEFPEARMVRVRLGLFLAVASVWLAVTSVARADDILDALDQARQAYQAGALAKAKQSADRASQLIGQKNAESFVVVLPKPMAGWTADPAQATSVGSTAFGSSQARRSYANPNGEHVDIQITGDSAVISQIAPIMTNQQISAAMGKIVMIGEHRAIQNPQGDVQILIANKFLVVVTGSASPAIKLAYAQAVDLGRLATM
jgi:hypothetical protein